MDWLDPLQYRTADPTRLPAAQPSERSRMAQVRAARRSEELAAARTLSELGMGQMWLGYARQFAAQSTPAQAQRMWAALQGAMLADEQVYSLQKLAYGEPRPFELGVKQTGDSYPSGHASTAYAAATVLAAFWPQRAGELFAAAANVARSRVYLDMHFPGDVADGARVGVRVAEQVLAQLNAGP